ncbi:hypothetical protein [Mycobacteroides abscessus]|uniref:hypothetical protein n=1 Tax=Mycobacteroides abscessus TaxID=36809 RepID=UPI0010C9DD5D|nr:hypothetical protein [Mycobacteroides abscessus]TKV35368.1 hypothetical protein CFA71_24190 [Mycobacteroides abscessus subsp. bolletii]
MNGRDVAAALAGAEALDAHVRRQREALGDDLTDTIYDVDPALQGLARAQAMMAKGQQLMDRHTGTARAAEAAQASARAACSGVELARSVEEVFDDQGS